MAADLVGIGLELIRQYGLIAIFILLVLDAAMLLPVFPGELVLVIAVGTFVQDQNSLASLIALTTVASMVGSLMLYGVTRAGGRRLVDRFPGFFMMPKPRRERLERTFSRPIGLALVLVLRVFPLTRVLVNIPAGLARMPIVRFVVLSTIGMALYHGGFLWFTYEAKRPGSTVEAQAAQIRNAYASPAWDFVQANAIVTGFMIVLMGAVISYRASLKMLHDPRETTGSLLGTFASAILFWGGILLALSTYIDPESVYPIMALGGVDMAAVSVAAGVAATSILFGLAAFGVVAGGALRALRRTAKMERRVALELRRLARRRRDEAAVERALASWQMSVEAYQIEVSEVSRGPERSVREAGSRDEPVQVHRHG